MGAEVMVAGPPTLIPKYIKEALDVKVEYNLKKALAMVRCCQCTAHSAGKAEPGIIFFLAGI